MKLFRFALSERDFRLAWLLAEAMGRDPAVREALTVELERASPDSPAPRTLPSLQVMSTVLASLGEKGGEG